MLVTPATSLWALSVAATSAAAIVIPPPSGPWSVKTEVHDLTDESRWDPFAPNLNSTHKRRILASTFLPVAPCDEADEVVLPYLTPATEAAYMEYMAALGVPGEVLTGFEVGYCAAGGSESGPPPGEYPLIVISPGFTTTRLAYGVQARALASLGFPVVTIDHPYDSLVVDFPNGDIFQLAVPDTPEAYLLAVDTRVKDISFLLDQLPIDTSKVIAIGHSMGGWASGALALVDDRVAGGMNLDGRMEGPVVDQGLAKPFLLVGPPETIAKGGQDGWRDFYDTSRDARMIISVNETVHNSYMDFPYMLSFKAAGIPPELLPILHAFLGSIDGKIMADILTQLTLGLVDLTFDKDPSTLKELEDQFEQVTIAEEDHRGC